MTKMCPCGSEKYLSDCCEPFILGKHLPETPEKLMRSRYTAYSQANMDYIFKTMKGKPLENFDIQNSKKWAKSVEWVSLKVLNTETQNTKAWVEFIARFRENDKEEILHEKSEFHLENGRWYYVDGTTPKTGRNDFCPCGSGKKFKKCCAI